MVDSLISGEEANFYVRDAKDAHGDPLFHIDEIYGDLFECSTAFQDWPKSALNYDIQDRVRGLIRQHFGSLLA